MPPDTPIPANLNHRKGTPMDVPGEVGKTDVDAGNGYGRQSRFD